MFYRGGRQIQNLFYVVAIVGFVFGLIVFAFSGCNLRKRGAKRACRRGNVGACLEVGRYYEGKWDGWVGYWLSNGNTSAEYYWRACKLKSDEACTHMMKMHYHTDNVGHGALAETDIIDALIGTCAEHAGPRPLDVPSCTELWDYMADTDWAQKRAAQHFTTLCDGGNAVACYWLARMHGDNFGGLQNVAETVIPIYDKACKGGVEDACKGARVYREGQAARENGQTAPTDTGAAVTSDAGASP